jgi:hypothetical protein
VQSLVRDPKKWARNVGRSYEKVDDIALPAIGFMLAGPAGAAAGSALARGFGDGKFDPKATAIAGLKGYAGGQLASGVGLVGGKGLSGLASSARGLVPGMGGGAGGGAASVASGATSAASGAASPSIGSSLMGGLKSVGGFAKDNPDLILGAAQAYQGAREQGKADDLSKRALELAEQPWNETAGLRRQSLRSLMNPTRTDLSGIYGGQSNPFARPYEPVAPVPLLRPAKPKGRDQWGRR